MDSVFRLTSDEYSKILGITTEALRSRRRRNQEDGNFKKVGKVFWWKSPTKDRPYIGHTRSNDRGPRALKPDSRKRRRGVMLNGEQTNYHNARNGWQLEELNRVRALGKIRDELGDEVLDEITPELFEQAKKRVAEKKEEAFKKANEKAQVPPSGVYSGYDHTPTIYGTTLNAVGLKNKADEQHRRLANKWIEETKVLFRSEPGKRHLPDFENRSNTSFKIFQNPYGPKVDDVAAEFNTWELPKDDRDPVFKNKVEESIYRLKKKGPY